MADSLREELHAEIETALARRLPGRGWAIGRHVSLALGLLIAVLQYYLIDIYVQIVSMQHVQFLTPETVPVLRKSALEVLRFFS